MNKVNKVKMMLNGYINRIETDNRIDKPTPKTDLLFILKNIRGDFDKPLKLKSKGCSRERFKRYEEELTNNPNKVK